MWSDSTERTLALVIYINLRGMISECSPTQKLFLLSCLAPEGIYTKPWAPQGGNVVCWSWCTLVVSWRSTTSPWLPPRSWRGTPRHCITPPDVFKNPQRVVWPDAVLNTGEVLFIAPNRMLYRLMRASPRTCPAHGSSECIVHQEMTGRVLGSWNKDRCEVARETLFQINTLIAVFQLLWDLLAMHSSSTTNKQFLDFQ